MTESKNTKEVERIIAITHLHELSVKSPIIHEWLMQTYAEIKEFADRNNINYSKINHNDILNTVHARINYWNNDGGNGIMADL